jgi:pimeloyl-ACP methyl ester carboxylesterase
MKTKIISKSFLVSIFIIFFAIASLNGAKNLFNGSDQIIGKWHGKLQVSGVELRLVFNIEKADAEAYSGTMDSPDQGASSIPLSGVKIDGNKIMFEVKSIGGYYEGILDESSNSIKGEWHQSSASFPLELLKETEPQKKQEEPNYISFWSGELDAGIQKLRLVLKIFMKDDGTLGAHLDSPDQGVENIKVNKIEISSDSLHFESASIGGKYSGKFNSDQTVVEGVWTQVRDFPLTLEKIESLEAIEKPKRPQEPEKPYPYNEEEVIYENKSAEIQLAGTFTIPEGNGPFPTVLLITGSGAQDRDETVMGHRPFLVLADHLTRNGTAVLRVDDRGVGKSTGSFKGSTTADFVTDVLAGVEYLTSRDEVDKNKIGLIGHSEGGLIAPLAANESEDVAFIILMAGPGLSGYEILMLQSELISRVEGLQPEEIEKTLATNRKIYDAIKTFKDSVELSNKIDEIFLEYLENLSEDEKQDPKASKDFLDMQKRQVLTPWFRYFVNYDPRPVLEKVKVPVLAMIGEKDLQVPPKENLAEIEKALKKSGNKNYKLVELKKLNHLFQTAETGSPNEYAKIEETMASEALELISDWIKEIAASVK